MLSAFCDEYGLPTNLLRAVYCFGIESMSSAQQTILDPKHDSKKSIFHQCKSGSGKTVGLVIKVVKEIELNSSKNSLNGLILVPTEYLALYVAEILTYMTETLDNNFETLSLTKPNERTRILVATPQLVEEYQVDLSNLNILAIDEMNLMLEIGSEYRKDIKSILKRLPNESKIVCTGCEMPRPECYIHDDRLKDSYIDQSGQILNELIIEKFVYCPKPNQKLDLLKEPLINANDFCVFFCNSQKRVVQSVDTLKQIYPNLEIAPQKYSDLTHSFTLSIIHLIGTEEDGEWLGINIPWCNYIVHFDVVCDVSKSRLRSGRCARYTRSGRVLYLPSTLEELDFVCELLLGSASCKYQRIMMRNVVFSDVVVYTST